MQVTLKKGVHLTCIPTTKFKTVRIVLRFQAMAKEAPFSKRALLSALLETSSQNYPTQTEISLKLAELYGASFSTYVSRKGNHHHFNLVMNVVNDRYLKNANVLEESIEFIRQILFYPNIQKGKFPEELFQREKQNMLQYIQSVKEDKQYYATQQLNDLFFQGNPAQSLSSYGSYSLMKEVENAQLVRYYEEMMANDVLDIFVIGDIEEEKVREHFMNLPFTDRKTPLGTIFYQEPKENVVHERCEQEKVAQSKLHLAYRHPVLFDAKDYPTLQVFNGIFGGLSTSKLFTIVREKESMAYYANSNFDSFRGMLSVQTGIDSKNREKVMQLIQEQLDAIRLGEIREEEMFQAKEMLKNAVRLSQDNMGTLIEMAFLKKIFPSIHQEVAVMEEKIDRVSVKEVAELAKKVTLSAVFFLEGKEGLENEEKTI